MVPRAATDRKRGVFHFLHFVTLGRHAARKGAAWFERVSNDRERIRILSHKSAAVGQDFLKRGYIALRAQPMHSAASGRALRRSGAICSPQRTQVP